MIVEVKLYNKTIGSIEWNDIKGISTFQYSSDFINQSIEPSPLVMPTHERIFVTNRDHINFHNLPYLLSDSMPDDFGNQDDHVKNFSFLMSKEGKWQLSPAYDITYQYKEGGKWTNVHQSSINGKFDKFLKDDLLGLGKTFGIKKANQILEEVIAAVKLWTKIATEIDIPKVDIERISSTLRINDFK